MGMQHLPHGDTSLTSWNHEVACDALVVLLMHC
jgi:hypothetical protein